MKRRNLPDIFVGLIFAALGVGIIVTASGLRTLPGMAVGSGFFPTITGAGMILFGLALSAQSLVPAQVDEEEEAADPDERRFVSAYSLFALAALAVLLLVMPAAGFIATGIVFALAMARLGGAGWIGSLVFAVVMTLGLYFVFVYGLRVPLPRGVLG